MKDIMCRDERAKSDNDDPPRDIWRCPVWLISIPDAIIHSLDICGHGLYINDALRDGRHTRDWEVEGTLKC